MLAFFFIISQDLSPDASPLQMVKAGPASV
jgi:hypothetical protein